MAGYVIPPAMVLMAVDIYAVAVATELWKKRSISNVIVNSFGVVMSSVICVGQWWSNIDVTERKPQKTQILPGKFKGEP